jgi:hypothetical protein
MNERNRRQSEKEMKEEERANPKKGGANPKGISQRMIKKATRECQGMQACGMRGFSWFCPEFCLRVGFSFSCQSLI